MAVQYVLHLQYWLNDWIWAKRNHRKGNFEIQKGSRTKINCLENCAIPELEAVEMVEIQQQRIPRQEPRQPRAHRDNWHDPELESCERQRLHEVVPPKVVLVHAAPVSLSVVVHRVGHWLPFQLRLCPKNWFPKHRLCFKANPGMSSFVNCRLVSVSWSYRFNRNLLI